MEDGPQVWWILFMQLFTTSAWPCLQHSRNIGHFFEPSPVDIYCQGQIATELYCRYQELSPSFQPCFFMTLSATDPYWCLDFFAILSGWRKYHFQLIIAWILLAFCLHEDLCFDQFWSSLPFPTSQAAAVDSKRASSQTSFATLRINSHVLKATRLDSLSRKLSRNHHKSYLEIFKAY